MSKIASLTVNPTTAMLENVQIITLLKELSDVDTMTETMRVFPRAEDNVCNVLTSSDYKCDIDVHTTVSTEYIMLPKGESSDIWDGESPQLERNKEICITNKSAPLNNCAIGVIEKVVVPL